MDKEFLKISGEDIKHGKVAIDVFEDKEKTFKAMAEEMVNYSKNNILAQAGQSMLAQANQSNQGVLSLLG